MLVPNPKGGYSFLKGIAPYSAGVVANTDFEIERARMAKPLPVAESFARLDTHLARLGRPPQALCGMELRSPSPFTFSGFSDFNASYIHLLEKRNILVRRLEPRSPDECRARDRRAVRAGRVCFFVHHTVAG